MPSKITSYAPDKTATEYVVAYFQVRYPNCRLGGYYDDSSSYYEPELRSFVLTNEAIKIQSGKKCFRSSCLAKPNCDDGRGPDCYWMHNASHDQAGIFEYDGCISHLKCVAADCPDANCLLWYNVSIGVLTTEELELFEKMAVEITDNVSDCGNGFGHRYLLQPREEIDKLSLEERVNYRQTNIENHHGCSPAFSVLKRYKEYADDIIAARKTPLSVAKPSNMLGLEDLKPPSEENGDWFGVKETEEILNDIRKLKGKPPLSKSTLRTCREGVHRIQDELTKHWHGKDTDGVFIRSKRKNESPEYFILCKKDSHFPREYPKLVDSTSDSPPPEAKILKKLQK